MLNFRRVVDHPEGLETNEEPLIDTGGGDGLDARIETLLRDWHHSPDLLFSIHPVDGSFLIWYVFSNVKFLSLIVS